MKTTLDDNDLFCMGALPEDPFEDGYIMSPALPPLPQEAAERTRGFRCTDVGNGRRFVAMYGRNLRYCASMVGSGWLLWSGGRWMPDRRKQITELAKTLSDDVRAEAEEVRERAAKADDPVEKGELEDVAKALQGWATRSESMAGIRNGIEAATSEHQVAIDIEELDGNPWLFNAKNGTVDLRNGQLRHHAREDLVTDMAGTDYDPKAECPLWLAFLDKIMGGDKQLVGFLRRAAGYSLVGVTPEQVMFILYGRGRNGKSTFINAIRRTLGSFARGTPVETLMAKREGAIPNDLAALSSARFVSTAEPREGKLLDEALVKQLTGGEPVSCRYLNREWFEYVPRYVLWMSTNHRPVIRGTDLGIWRRLHLVPFTVTIDEKDIDPDLDVKLRAELPGILAWMVRGCLEWQRDGLNPPASVVAANNDYRQDMDLVQQFIDECCQPHATVENTQLFEAFDRWRRRQAEPERSQKWLTRQLKDKGYIQFTPSSGPRSWRGLTLNHDVHPAPAQARWTY